MGWVKEDLYWIDAAAQSALIVSASGMAVMAAALVYQRPVLLIQTDQPEQALNIEKARQLELHYRCVTWQDDPLEFEEKVKQAVEELLKPRSDGGVVKEPVRSAQERLDDWVKVILDDLMTA